jgi:hypothetical protein
MNKIGHLIVGLILGIAFIFISNYYWDWFSLWSLEFFIAIVLIIPLYALLPDIDHEAGTITWWFIGLGILGAIVGAIWNRYLLYFSLAILVITFLAVKLTHHRGIIHTIEAGIIFAIPMIFIFDWSMAILAFIAFYSHLLADGLPFKIK